MANTIDLPEGNNLYYGTNDDDDIRGRNGNDTIFGLGGRDIIFGGGGSDTLYGNGDKDLLYGGNASDTLYGGRGDDVLVGGSGKDKLSGDYGRDQLQGDAGDDLFYFDSRTAGVDEFGNAASDLILDFQVGDVIHFGGYGPSAALQFVQGGSNVLISVDVDGNGSADYLAVTVLNATLADVQAATSFGDFNF